MNARCDHWIGDEGRYCGAPNARRYVNSTACPLHTPNALRGLPEAPPGPGAPRDWAAPHAHRTPTARDQRPLSVVPKAT